MLKVITELEKLGLELTDEQKESIHYRKKTGYFRSQKLHRTDRSTGHHRGFCNCQDGQIQRHHSQCWL